MDKSKEIFKARKICCQMLTDRNYTVPEGEEDISYDNFKLKMQNEDLDLYINSKENPNERIFLRFFMARRRINESDFKKEIENIYESTSYNESADFKLNIIFITQEKSSSNVLNIVGTGRYSNIELFNVGKLQYNRINHILQPKFEPVKKDMEQDILDFYSCSKAQLPKILHTDPVAQYYGLKPGDLIKVTRISQQTGQQIVYKHIK